MAAIRRDFLPRDLRGAIEDAGVDGVISVQARQNLQETDWLLGMAGEHDFIRAVTGWLPLAEPGIEAVLEKYAVDPYLRAVRHVVQDEPDDDFILGDDFNRGISLLNRFDLIYEILIFEKHLPQTISFVERHPETLFVLDHIAKPRIGERLMQPWMVHITELAEHPNVYCKLSGMVTEAGALQPSAELLRPYFGAVLEAFGPQRLMFGSDWPVSLVSITYGGWLRMVKDFIAELSTAEQELILGGNAARVYRLTE